VEEEMQVALELGFLQEFQDKVIQAEQPVEQLLDMLEAVAVEQEQQEPQLGDLPALVVLDIHGLIQVPPTLVVAEAVDKELRVELEVQV
jgi:hypothetical protein